MGFFDLFKKKTEIKPHRDIVKEMTEFLGYPYRFFPAGTDYRIIDQEYFDAVKRGKDSDFTPVLVKADSLLSDYLGITKKDGYSVEELLEKGADAEKGKLFLNDRFNQFFAPVNGVADTDYNDFIREYEGKPKHIDKFISVFDFSGKTEDLILFEIPTKKPWEVAAYIPFGGWNECPPPAEMMNVLKYWFEKYHVVPAAISHDTLELVVPEPVSEYAAMETAKEHFAFSPDRVLATTDTSTITEIAESLKVSAVWYFWWD